MQLRSGFIKETMDQQPPSPPKSPLPPQLSHEPQQPTTGPPSSESGQFTQTKIRPVKLSELYVKYNGNIPEQVLRRYALELGTGKLADPTGSIELMIDQSKTLARIEADRTLMREGLTQLDRTMMNLPDSGAQTVKLNELVIKPEVFDGLEPKPRKWIQDYNEAIVANGWSDVIAIKYLPTYLSNAAKDWYFVDVKPKLRTGTKWYQVYDEFIKNYLSASDLEQLSNAVENARQRANESVCNFFPRMRRLILLLTPGMPEEEQLRMLKNKLRPEYKQLMTFSDPQNIQELRTCCLKIEAGLTNKAEIRTRRGERDSKIKSKDESRPRENMKGLRRRFARIDTKESSPDSDEKNAEITCYNCGEKGHYSRGCPSKRYQRNSNQNRRQVNNVNEYDPVGIDETDYTSEDSYDTDYTDESETDESSGDGENGEERTSRVLTVRTNETGPKSTC